MELVQHAYARDVYDDTVLGGARLQSALVGFGELRELTVDPATGDTGALVGAHVGAGFRTKARRAFPDDAGTPLGLLLDDLPVATLVAGYSRVVRRLEAGVHPAQIVGREGAELRRDLCSGWRGDGEMIRSIEAGEGIPYPPLPEAPAPRSPATDPLAWPDEPVANPGAMHRRRRIDVFPGEALVVDAWFRDSHVESDGHEGAVHEYTVHATVAPETFEILAISALPHVLPYGECPSAAANVGRLVGAHAGDLRRVVGDAIGGTASCTHLNDCLRGLADVPFLATALVHSGQ